MSDIAARLKENLADVRERMSAACRGAGRPDDAVTLVAVTKTVDAATTRMLYDLGVRELGENRTSQAEEKAAALSDLDIRWHMIGHLQRNKVKKALPIFGMIHSVDSLRLAREIDKEARKRGMIMDVLIQANTSGEESKFGLAPEEALSLVKEAAGMAGLRVKGLMTMAPFYDNPEDCRPCFRALRELRDETAKAGIEKIDMKYLSMGMTNDFEIAIEEGADIVRVGSALFRGIVPATQH
ncbi:MAG: YggS family pyridoxal phosphate-dependent enzyme [Planctomycetes bacterium]|nr:YggS family pyridoxal phosphate-dependent enzyme [Planctomycetota bacterium]